MKKDFTGSTKTKAGWPVKGLFEEGEYVRGYFGEDESWVPSTWSKSTGRYLTFGTEVRDYDLVEPEPPF